MTESTSTQFLHGPNQKNVVRQLTLDSLPRLEDIVTRAPLRATPFQVQARSRTSITQRPSHGTGEPMVSSAHGRLLSLRAWAPDGEDDVPPCTIVAVQHLPPPPAGEKSAAVSRCARNWLLKALTTIAVLGGLVLTLLWGKLYVRECLVWLDSQDSETVCLVFVLMYTLVAFPLTWGYILLNFACGYHFGLVLGVAVTAAAASVGISVAHTVMKRFFLGFIMARLLSSEVVRSTLALLDTGHAFKVVIISRLTPIPFGLQNAMFANTGHRAAGLALRTQSQTAGHQARGRGIFSDHSEVRPSEKRDAGRTNEPVSRCSYMYCARLRCRPCTTVGLLTALYMTQESSLCSEVTRVCHAVRCERREEATPPVHVGPLSKQPQYATTAEILQLQPKTAA
ncbi:hypothetical protein HPB51_025521 [Rhipicephalus microplus]|uniref:Uncharacterized protein n=1 Tax=Rhipicephalus microplus TaxID=6941 RepID=A0A9J6DDT8_RHIMP|nr:hypothetical protein HPB51_025521 [Rhipicephalus microplus]